MKERVAPRRLIVPSLLLPAVLVAVGCVVFGSAPAAAEGDNLFEGERYDLVPPPETYSLPAEVFAATIFGEDNRMQIEDTTEWPYRTVTHLVMFDVLGEASHQCSGVLLNVNVVLTAAHCVWDEITDAPYGSILAIPGEDGIGSEPFGEGWAEGYSITIPRGFTETDEPEFDFGLVHLDGYEYGSEVGPFALIATASDAFFSDEDTFLVTPGYPGDKPLGTQWVTSAWVDHVEPTLIFAQIDSYGGQSGSAMFGVNRVSDESAIVGVFTSASQLMARGVRLSDLHVDALHDYCDDAGCSFSSTHLEAPTTAPTPTDTPTPSATPTASPTSPPGPSTLPFKTRLAYVGRD